MKRFLRWPSATLVPLLVIALAMGGCATIDTARGGPGKRLDPWENWNRKVFAFNEGLDEKFLKPIATVDRKSVV